MFTINRYISKDDLKKEYFKLKQQSNLSDDTIINDFVDKIGKDYLLIEQCNNIYVYMGTYRLVHDSNESWYPVREVLVDENNQFADYKVFKSLDAGEKFCVRFGKDMEDFEKDNVIIVIPNVRSFESVLTFEEDYKKLRKLYFTELLTKDEDTAISVVTSEEWIKKIFSVENYLKEYNISSVFYQAFFETALCNQKPKKVQKII